MIKSLIKEITIILLLILAIVLILGILFYEYRPSTQKIPVAVESYSLPDDMQEELNETIEAAKTQNIVKTYRVDSEDLKDYKASNDYKQGKINPFDRVSETKNETTGQNNVSGNVNTSNQTQTNTTQGSQGSFLNTIK